MKFVSGTIKLRVRGEPVEIALTIPQAPVHPQAMLPALQKMTDAFVAHAVRQSESEGKFVTCMEGCWACCRHLIPVSETEAYYLAELVAAMPEPRRSELQLRFRETIEILKDADLLEPLRHPARPGSRSLHDLGMAFFERNISCPFLENHRCSIHAKRPLACREHLVTSPPQNCDHPTAESIEKLPMPASVFGALINLSKSADTKAAPFVPLVLALEWASQHPDRDTPRPGPQILKQITENLSGKPVSRLLSQRSWR